MERIFFSASTYAVPELMENYLAIIKEINKNKSNLILDWTKDWKNIALEYQRRDKKKIKESDVFKVFDRKKFHEEHTKAIKDCDLVIAEVTRPTITVGYQLFYAISNKKPALALYSENVKNFDLDAIRAIINTESPYVTLKKYNIKLLPLIIRNFIKKRAQTYKKFNFIMTEEIGEYVRWLQSKSEKKSMSEVLRTKILNELMFNDTEYQDYLDKIKR